MLELPEVLTLSKQANDVLSGKTITQVDEQTYVPAERGGHSLNILTEDGALAGTWFEITTQYIDGSGFSCTIFS